MQNRNSSSGNGNMNSYFRTNAARMNTEAGSMGQSSIDSKDLSIVEDQMYKEALLYKKCTTYANYFTDPNLKSMASTAAEHHRQHFDTLHGYLNASK